MSKKNENRNSKTLEKDVKKKEFEEISLLKDKTDFIAYFFIFCISALIYGLSAKLVLANYNYNIDQAVNYAKSILCVNGYSPEPIEKTLYFLAVFVFALLFFGLILLINRFKPKIESKTINKLFWIALPVSIFFIILLCYKCFVAQNPYFENIQNSQDVMKSNWDFYFSSTFIHTNLLIFSFIIFPILLFLFYRSNIKSNKAIQKMSAYSTYTFCGIIIVIIFFITAFTFPYTFENKYDFNAIYYSVVQVFHGAPMLVDNFTNTYGLYPHFVIPFLKIFGLSIHSFTIIMAILLCVCFIFLLKVLDQFIDNKWLVLFGFTAVFFNSYLFFRIATPYDCGFSIHPIRWISLFSLLFYASHYVKHKTKLLYYLSFIFFALCILWNPESGIVSFLCLTAFYCFLDLDKDSFGKIFMSWIKNIAIAFSIAISTFLVYMLLIKVFYGNYPDLLKLFSTIQVFSSIGLGMLPMPKTFHPYILILIIYFLGLLFTINNIISKKINDKTAFLFLVTSIGILFFPYYIGRSHNWNLFACSPMVFIIIALFTDDLLKKIAVNKTLIPLFGILLYCISFSFFQTVYDYKKITDLVSENDNKITNRDDNEAIKRNAEYIKRKTKENERILILAAVQKQGLYHVLSNTASAFNPGFIELFFKTDYERLLATMEKDDIKVFFEPTFRFTDLQIFPVLASDYEYKESNRNFYYFEKRKENKLLKPLLTSGKNELLHKVLDADLKEKVAYAQGEKGGITLGRQFSIEVVMKPQNIPQSVFTQSATVFSNITPKNGFIFRQNDTIQNQYIFGFSNQGIICQPLINKWNYIVFVVDNNKITCYVNNTLVGAVENKTAYENNTNPLYIGSQNANPGFFFGDIREIKFSNGLIDSKEILESWNKVQSFAQQKP